MVLGFFSQILGFISRVLSLNKASFGRVLGVISPGSNLNLYAFSVSLAVGRVLGFVSRGSRLYFPGSRLSFAWFQASFPRGSIGFVFPVFSALICLILGLISQVSKLHFPSF